MDFTVNGDRGEAPSPTETELLKLAYEQAQQSAEHHDTLVWEATYIVWGSTTLLLGFVLEAVKSEPFLCFVTAALSIFMTVMVWFLTKAFQNVRKQKYEMCQDIEKRLNMPIKPHTDLVGKKGIQTKYYVVTTLLLVVVWVCVACVCLYYIHPKPFYAP